MIANQELTWQQGIGILFIAGFIGAVIWLLRHAWIWNTHRTRTNRAAARAPAIRRIADSLGLSFSSVGDPGCIEGEFRLAGIVDGLYHRDRPDWVARNTIHGQIDGLNIICFEHECWCRVSNSEGGKSWVWSKPETEVLIWPESDQVVLPDFHLAPENRDHRTMDAVAGAFGKFLGTGSEPRDINFESHPTFSNAYRLNGENEERIRCAFNPDVLNLLETHVAESGTAEFTAAYHKNHLKISNYSGGGEHCWSWLFANDLVDASYLESRLRLYVRLVTQLALTSRSMSKDERDEFR
jgi:hypothetical protein